ncbi:MAG: hypothetical protein ACRCTS_07625 [Fusobacteriaceae bacterium]
MSILKRILGKKDTGCCSKELEEAIKKAKESKEENGEKDTEKNNSSCCGK